MTSIEKWAIAASGSRRKESRVPLDPKAEFLASADLHLNGGSQASYSGPRVNRGLRGLGTLPLALTEYIEWTEGLLIMCPEHSSDVSNAEETRCLELETSKA